MCMFASAFLDFRSVVEDFAQHGTAHTYTRLAASSIQPERDG
jgi:hypothetical protein